MQPSKNTGIRRAEQTSAEPQKQDVGKEVVRPEGFETPTLWFEASCSIQLSYGRIYDRHYCNAIARLRDYFVAGGAVGCASGGGGMVNKVTRSMMSSPARRRS